MILERARFRQCQVQVRQKKVYQFGSLGVQLSLAGMRELGAYLEKEK